MSKTTQQFRNQHHLTHHNMSSRDEPRRRSRSPRGGRDRRDDRRDDYRSDGRRDAPRRDEYSSRDDPRDWDRDSRDRDHDRYDYRRGHDRDRDRPRDYDRRDPYARDREYTRGGLDYGRRGGGGGRRSRSRSRSPPRTLDRCAIEEARRKREEERARGVVFLEDGTKIVPKGEERRSLLTFRRGGRGGGSTRSR